MMRKAIALLLCVGLVLGSAPSFAANGLYGPFKAACLSYNDSGGANLSAVVNLKTDTIKAILVSASIVSGGTTYTYTPSRASDQFLAVIPTQCVIGTPVSLTYSSSTAGTYKTTNNVTVTIPSGVTVNYLILYKDTGVATTSPLILCDDTFTGFPFTASVTTSLTITQDTTNGWFTL